jgi:hypothetical protein
VLAFVRYPDRRSVLAFDEVFKAAPLAGLGLPLRPLEQFRVELPGKYPGLHPPEAPEPPSGGDDPVDERTLRFSHWLRLIESETRLRAARGIAKSETGAALEAFEAAKETRAPTFSAILVVSDG